MRKIKFRGKSIVSGEWVEGDLIQDTNADNQEEAWIITDDYSGDVITFGTCQSPQVDINTIGQYTGHKDIDKEEIYGGDIVIFGNLDTAIVLWSEEKSSFIVKPIEDYYFDSDILGEAIENSYSVEVIGNIYDNPELLNDNT